MAYLHSSTPSTPVLSALTASPAHQLEPAPSNDLDAETAALIARLALEDLEAVLNESKGKSRADAPLSDQEYAYKLQSQHFQEYLLVSEDEKYARSIACALSTDAAYLEALIAAEEAAAQDRRAAEIVARGEALPPPTPAQRQMENPAFDMHPARSIDAQSLSVPLRQPAESKSSGKAVDSGISLSRKVRIQDPPPISPLEWNVGQSDDLDEYTNWDENASILSSGLALKSAFDPFSLAPGPSANHNKRVQCTICNDSLSYRNALQTPCDHNYCGGCVVHLVESFTRDESLFPLRCCQKPIPIADVDTFISSTLRATFLKKHAEFSVLSKDRLYCFAPTCSAFLGSTEGVNAAGVICPACASSTCPRCKQAEHAGEDCVVNAATIAVRALGREQGWQICPQCHTLVELSIGCYHMTCRCRAQFCYLCAARWKDCTCPQWEETRLLETAQQRIENEIGARAARAMEPEVLVQQVRRRAQDLRNNHYCERHIWRYRSGGGQCEECNHYLDQFLKICKNCSLLACVRCTRNRI